MSVNNANIVVPNPVMRYDIADYLGLSDGTFELMGLGFESLNESPNAQSSGKTYINQKSQASFVKSYQTEFPYSADMIKSEKALMELYKVARDHLTGAAAMFEYVRVDLYDPVVTTSGEGAEATTTTSTEEFKARKFIVSDEVSSVEGAGGDSMMFSGTLKAFGDHVEGTFNVKTKKFTEATSSTSGAGTETV